MAERHSKATIISMAVLASAAATLLHEGVGHGVTAWLRGDVPTQLTSNHLSRVLLQIAMKRASGSRGRMCELNSDTEQPVNEPDVSDNIPLC
jgi:hypothetical protein